MNRFSQKICWPCPGFIRVLGASFLIFLTGCTEIWPLEQGSLPEIYALTDRAAIRYAQDSFSRETVLCSSNFLLVIKGSKVEILRVETDFGQKGHKHNAYSDGPEGNLRNVRRNKVIFDVSQKKVNLSRGLPGDLDMVYEDWADAHQLQGCHLDIDVSKKPWRHFDPYLTLKKADALGAIAYRKAFCEDKLCWAQVYSDGTVNIGFELANSGTEVTSSPTASKVFQTEHPFFDYDYR